MAQSLAAWSQRGESQNREIDEVQIVGVMQGRKSNENLLR
jgi:hypothetical protein